MRSKNERTPKERIKFLVERLNVRKQRQLEREERLKASSPPKPKKKYEKREKEKKEEPPIVQLQRQKVREMRERERLEKEKEEERRKRELKRLRHNSRLDNPFTNKYVTFISKVDVTREDLMEMEKEKGESGRIDWKKWDELIKIYRIQQCFQKEHLKNPQ